MFRRLLALSVFSTLISFSVLADESAKLDHLQGRSVNDIHIDIYEYIEKEGGMMLIDNKTDHVVEVRVELWYNDELIHMVPKTVIKPGDKFEDEQCRDCTRQGLAGLAELRFDWDILDE